MLLAPPVMGVRGYSPRKIFAITDASRWILAQISDKENPHNVTACQFNVTNNLYFVFYKAS
jgi:hypothetical protein